MAIFNSIVKPDPLVNHEGSEAWVETPEMELYTAVATCSLANKFYETAEETLTRIVGLIGRVEPRFVARLAVYTRTKMNLRAIPLFLLVELARVHRGDSLVADAVAATVNRADEIMELLACYQWRNPREGRKKLSRLSTQILSGLKRAFNKFDEYQFAKYNNSQLEVKLRDALFLVRPKAIDESRQLIFDKIASRSLSTPYTWETELSALGQTCGSLDEEARQNAFAHKWEELIMSGKLGYMAILRNLVNILSYPQISDEAIATVCQRLADPAAVAASKQLPFRFWAAYIEIARNKSPHAPKLVAALEEAALATAQNLPFFGQDCSVAIAVDVSESMFFPISPRSMTLGAHVGLLLAMLLKSRCQNAITGLFGEIWKEFDFPGNNILANTMESLNLQLEVGYATNGYRVLTGLLNERRKVDKIMMFTDCQMWDTHGDKRAMRSAWAMYKRFNPQARLYLFDLAGYGASPLKLQENDVALIGGWSDKIFDILQAVERGSSAVEEINKIEL